MQSVQPTSHYWCGGFWDLGREGRRGKKEEETPALSKDISCIWTCATIIVQAAGRTLQCVPFCMLTTTAVRSQTISPARSALSILTSNSSQQPLGEVSGQHFPLENLWLEMLGTETSKPSQTKPEVAPPLGQLGQCRVFHTTAPLIPACLRMGPRASLTKSLQPCLPRCI